MINSLSPYENHFTKTRKLLQKLVDQSVVEEAAVWPRAPDGDQHRGVGRALLGQDLPVDALPLLGLHLEDVDVDEGDYGPEARGRQG